MLDGEIFDASLSNSGFNQDKIVAHKTDIVRVMYGNNSLIPEELKAAFSFSLTTTKRMFEIEPIKAINISSDLISEDVFESNDLTWIDRTASIEKREKLIKIRKVDRCIGDNLKRLYDYRCEIIFLRKRCRHKLCDIHLIYSNVDRSTLPLPIIQATRAA